MAYQPLTPALSLLFRTYPIRFLGLGFPVAEALFFGVEDDHWSIDLAYTISSIYIISHGVYEGLFVTYGGSYMDGFATCLTVLLWELLASIIFPSLIIHRICDIIDRVVPDELGFIPTLSGLMALPVVAVAVDLFVDFLAYVVEPFAAVFSE